MPPVPVETFVECCRAIVKKNAEYVPPYGTGGSMYIRPLLIGTGPQIGVAPAKEYTFMIMVMPVGAYYKGGLKPVRYMRLAFSSGRKMAIFPSFWRNALMPSKHSCP